MQAKSSRQHHLFCNPQKLGEDWGPSAVDTGLEKQLKGAGDAERVDEMQSRTEARCEFHEGWQGAQVAATPTGIRAA
jgi:hypothetical protein